MKPGASNFLRKPFRAETLRSAVQAALGESPSEGLNEPPVGITYGLTTLNGFRIEYQPGGGIRKNGETIYTFTVLHPEGPGRKSSVALPTFMKELVKAHAD